MHRGTDGDPFGSVSKGFSVLLSLCACVCVCECVRAHEHVVDDDYYSN